MKSGLTQIYEERAEHLIKHGYGAAHDYFANGNGQLLFASTAIFLSNRLLIPLGWSISFFDRVFSKPRPKQLIIAGSLLLAEMARHEVLLRHHPAIDYIQTMNALEKGLNDIALAIDNLQIQGGTMAALTLLDYTPKNPTPWASMMEVGVKIDESRKWAMPKTRELPFDCLICASAASKSDNAGLAVCVVEIYQCVPFTEEYEQTVCCERYDGFVFRTRNLRWLSRKFPVKGQLGFFGVDFPGDVTLVKPTHEQLVDARLAMLENPKLV